MQLRQLFANVLANPKELKVESKEQFFNTKHRQKRMKKSTCFSEQIEIEQHASATLDSSLASLRSHDPKANCKELESTFGEENVLAFRAKPPKRKRNLRNCQDKQKREDSDSSSDSESSMKNSLVFTKKAPQALKSPQECRLHTAPHPLRIEDFLILGKIGEGSYSEVWRAVERRSGFVCALKVLEKWKMRELNVQENVVREIKLNMFLAHPNIARLYACFHDAHRIYLVAEYATHGSLYELIKQPARQKKEEKREGGEQTRRLVGQVCEAVRFIHQHAVMHRDLKPENILLTMGSTVKLCDFGWSVHNPHDQMRLTLCGTPLYLAPEMVAQTSYDDSIDIWAIGVMTYELLAEESPFQITQLRDLSKIIHEEIRLERIDDPAAGDFIRQATEKNPSKRKSIFQLCRHPFVAHFFQSNQAL